MEDLMSHDFLSKGERVAGIVLYVNREGIVFERNLQCVKRSLYFNHLIAQFTLVEGSENEEDRMCNEIACHRKCRGKVEPSFTTVVGVPSCSMDHSVRYLSVTRKIMSLAGLWETKTHRRLLRYYFIGFMALYTILGQLCQIFTSSFDLWSAVRLLQILVPYICGISQYFNAVLHFNTIHKVYSYIVNDWQQLRDDTELKIMQKYAHYANLFTLAGLVLFYLYGIISVLPPLLRITLSTNEIRSDLDLYPVISCFDYFSNRDTYYYPIIIYQIISTYVIMTVSIASYSMYFLFIQHACARLSIMAYRIYSPFVINNIDDDIPVTSIDLSPWIIDIIQRLARTTEFMNMVNTSCEKSYLFQMFLAFLLLILDLLCIPALLQHNTSIKDVVGLVIYIFSTLSTIYVNCYIGQRLMDFSTDVNKEAGVVPFYEMSLRTQKLLLTTLAMSAKPYAASIGKVYVASHEFFGNLLRSALSFAMVLRSLQTT